MITEINKIKNLGIFSDYVAHTSLPEFKRYNLVYGWNGSGKTTMTRLFTALESGVSTAYPLLEYKITADANPLTQKLAYSRKFRVFNRDYVTDNSPSLEDPSAETKHIFILGKQDKDLALQIEKDKAEKAAIEALMNAGDKKSGTISLKMQRAELVKSKNTLFTSIAKTIASSRGRAFRDYDKRDAEKVYGTMLAKEELDPTELERLQAVIEQKSQATLDPVKIGSVRMEQEEVEIADATQRLLSVANDLLAKTIEQQVVERLKDNSDIAEWVAEGVELHAKHESGSCEYCGQTIPASRISELAAHFNEAHKNFILSLDEQLRVLREVYAVINATVTVDKSNLYDHLRDDYEENRKLFEASKQQVLEIVTQLGSRLNDKKVKTHIALPHFEDIELASLSASLAKVNVIIAEHNKLSGDFEAATTDAKAKLEKHYISTVRDEAKRHEADLVSVDAEIEKGEKRVRELTISITAAEATLRDTKIACGQLNAMLEQFLGRNEIVFEDTQNGYLIKRNDELAHHLSEGEKTAIAFVHFVIGLQADGFALKEAIVVVDDPISSLDSDAVYRLCGLIKTKLKNAHQLFLLTHNYEFFNQIKNWFDNDPDVGARNADPTKVMGEFFMIKNPYNTTIKRRVAEIDNLDPLLRNYESEYHYLFQKLVKHKEDIIAVSGQDTIEAVYPYPNIARKVMECFLSFRVPMRGSLYTRMSKMRSFNKAEITGEEVEEVYAFVNSNSHLDSKTGLMQFDSKLAKNGERCIQMTLELIKKCDQKHYEAMVKSCSI